MTLAEPTILRTESTADFLSTVPALVGFTARNSIIVIPFVGKRSRPALRLDLPRDEKPATARAIGDGLVRLATELSGADGIAVVIYTDQTFAAQHGTPHLLLWRGIRSRIHRADLALKEACCVAADGWVSYLEARRPSAGHPLTLITESSMALEANYLADGIPDVSSWKTLPEPDPATARRVADTARDLLMFGERVDAFGIVHDAPPDVLALAERIVATPTSELPPSVLAEIIATTDVPELRDALLAALAFGAEAGARSLERSLAMWERRERTGESYDDIARAEVAERGWDDDDLMFAGRSQQRPDQARVLAAIGALRQAAAHAPPHLRGGVLCVLAWMLWSRGLVSFADSMLDLAGEADPQLSMVNTLGMLFDTGYPGWALPGTRG